MIKDRDKRNAYMREYHLKRYYALRNEAISKLGGKCVNCNLTEDLQFDHKDPATKESQNWLGLSIKNFWKEIDKCQLLCRTCHELKSILECGKQPAKGTHGSVSAYRYCGPPKCELCKAAKREYARKYRESTPV